MVQSSNPFSSRSVGSHGGGTMALCLCCCAVAKLCCCSVAKLCCCSVAKSSLTILPPRGL